MRAIYSINNKKVPVKFKQDTFLLQQVCEIPVTMDETQLPKHRLLLELHLAIFYFLSWDEGFLGKNVFEMVDAMKEEKRKTGYFSNKSLLRAAHFRDFLLYYPKNNTAQELLADVCFLYASKKEFPEGLGNSQKLRMRICERLSELLYEPYMLKMLSCNANAKPEMVDQQVIFRQKNINSFIYLICALHRIFPLDIGRQIADITAQLRFTTVPKLFFQCQKRPDVTSDRELVNVDIEDESDFSQGFVLMK